MTLRTLNYGNYGTFLIMGNAGFCPSTIVFISYWYYVARCGKGDCFQADGHRFVRLGRLRLELVQVQGC